MSKLRILVADDQALMRDGLKTILDLEDDMEVVGTAENGKEAYELTRLLSPDLVLMDVKMPVMDGVESTKRIKEDFPNTNVIVLTNFNEEDYIIEALAFGASGYLLKEMQGDQLARSVREGSKGQMMLPSKVAAKLAVRLSASRYPIGRKREFASEEDQYTPLTEREKLIASYMIENYTNKEIARKLKITEGTLKNYISIIYEKIGTNERLKAIKYLKRILRDGNEQA